MIWMDMIFIMTGKVELYIGFVNVILGNIQNKQITKMYNGFQRDIKMLLIFAFLHIFGAPWD